MNKQEVLKDYKKEDDRLLLAQILDKIKAVELNNKIEYTNFLDIYQINLVESFLKKIKYVNYILWGGYEFAERKLLIVYPEKFTQIEKNYDDLVSVIRIILSNNEDKASYTHRVYLGGIMKLGVEREKIGDILVQDNGADIIVKKDISKYLLQELPMLTRFEKAEILEEKIENLIEVELKAEEIKIIVPSLRLDNFVSDFARTSRSKAVEIIKNERVFINGQNETKVSKQVKVGDTVTIRGKGRFIIKEFSGTTRSGRTVVVVDKYA